MSEENTPPQKRDRPKVARRKDVAELAKVSPSTVSLVLNNTPGPRIPDATRERIIAAANQLGYQPNAVARALVTGKSMTIGVVFHYIGNPFYDTASAWLNGVWEVFRPRDYKMTLAEGAENRPVAGMYRQRGVDGLLMLVPPSSPEDTDSEYEQMLSANFPCVSIGSHFAKSFGDYIDTDNFEVARSMTKQLIEAGHKRILHITGPYLINSSALDRLNGYKQALKDHGIPIDESLIKHGNYTGDMASELMNEVFDQQLSFTAVFASNASTAHSAIAVMRARGFDVPKDYSICAIDLPFQTAPIDYQLVTYQQSLHAIGVKAGELLLERIESDHIIDSRKFFPEGKFIAGNTIRTI